MNHYYNQLAGALGVLKQNGTDLPWSELDEKLKKIAAENGPDQCDTEEVREMHKKFRDQCLSLGLINAGELFDIRDSIPLSGGQA